MVYKYQFRYFSNKNININQNLPTANRSNAIAFASRTGGPGFNSCSGQIGHTVANGLPQLQLFFKGICYHHHN